MRKYVFNLCVVLSLITVNANSQILNGDFSSGEAWTFTGGGGIIDTTAVLVPATPGTNPSTLSQDFDCMTPLDGNCWVTFQIIKHDNVNAEIDLGGVSAPIPGVGMYQIKHKGCGELSIKFEAERKADGDPIPELEIDNVFDICTYSNVPPFEGDDITPVHNIPTLSQWSLILLTLLLLIISVIGIRSKSNETQPAYNKR